MIPIIEIIKIKNPFDRTCREVEQVIFVPGKRLTEYIDEPEFDYILNSNFVEQPELTYPSDGDQIVILPYVGGGMKKILGVIASIMLSNWVGGILKGSILPGLTGISRYLAAGAVMFIGGRIINSVFGVKQKSLNADNSSSQTYGWDLPKPLTGEGNIVGITYGECIPAPQLLESHIDTANDKQYINILLCGGMGPIDEITDIKIGGNPIANYTDVQYDVRLGTNDQEPIINFNNTTNNQELSYELSDSVWSTQVIDSDNAQALLVTVEFPNGLYHINDKGNLEKAWVKLAAEYRLIGGNWVSWFGSGSYISSTSIPGASCYSTAPPETWTVTIMKSGDANLVKVEGSVSGSQLFATGEPVFDNGKVKFTVPSQKGTYTINIANDAQISAAQNTAVRRSFRIDGLTAGKYEVRMMVTGRSAAKTSTRDSTTVYWTQLTSIIYGEFCRPNKVLVGIRILATGQLSGGIPDVTWRQKRNTVWVWNPETGQYETRAANNPIWATYDIYHQCRYMKNINTGQYEYVVFGVAHSRLDPYWHEWVECAAYADEQVTGLAGSLENRFEFDAFFDTEQKRYDAAQQAAAVGHATVVPRGNNIGIVCDKPGTMTQVFGEGRTTMSSLQGTFSGIEDRATAVEVVFSDTTNDFKNTQFMVRSSNWAKQTTAQDNPAQLQLFGVKRKSQAYREGVYTLANNLLITQFIDIGTDIDALVCQYGDIVGLNHSVAQMGIASGRLVSASVNTVILDKPVSVTAGKTYQIIVCLSANDAIIKKNTVPVNADMDTDTLTVTEPFATIPAKFDNYMFGEADKAVKPFRLVGVEKTGDLTCKLSLAEYVEGVYSGDLNYPLIDYTPPGSSLFEVSNLSVAEENYLTTDGIRVSLLHASWSIENNQRADAFFVYYSTDGTDWRVWERTYDTRSTIRDINPGRTYYVKVRVVKEPVQSNGVIKSLYITGRDALPPDVLTLMIEKIPSGTYRFSFTTDGTPVDLAGYRVKYNVGNSKWWQTAIPLVTGLVHSSPFELFAIPTGVITVLIKAVDNAGNESQNAAFAILGLGDMLVENVLFTHDFKGLAFPGTKTNCHIEEGALVADSSGDMMYPVDLDSPMYQTDLAFEFYRVNWPAMTYEDTFYPEQKGSLSFAYDIDGNNQIFYRQQYPYSMYGNEYDPFYPGETEQMYQEGPWLAYSGKVEIKSYLFQVRVIINSGITRGKIKSFAAVVDVPDVKETFEDITIAVGGTRLPITKKFIRIKYVNCTIQDTGGTTAEKIKVIDKNQLLGPLLIADDGGGNSVEATIDCTVEGY